MSKIAYDPTLAKRIRGPRLAQIERINSIIAEYQAAGYSLTLRQLYYQLVARGLIPNTERSYKNTGTLIADGRMAGLISWSAITDRGRIVRSNPHWDDPADIIKTSAEQYRIDLWEGQTHRPRVLVEKDALVGVVQRPCRQLDVPYLACRGYPSASVIWEMAMEMVREIQEGYTPVVIHLGDHDPSGLDMTRDLRDRLATFVGYHVGRRKGAIEVNRIALNMSQIEEYGPPPNPAKLTDPRGSNYVEEYGDESWELDALEPTVLDVLIREAVVAYRDDDKFEERWQEQERGRKLLTVTSDYWDDISTEIEYDYADELAYEDEGETEDEDE